MTIVFAGKSAITATRGSNDPELGLCKVFEDEDKNEYIYAYNASNSEVPPGMLVQLNSAATNMSFTLTNTTNTGLSVGMVKNATFTTGTYGWLLKRGFGNIEMNATSGTIGARAAIYLGVDGVGAVTGASENAAGYALEAIISAASGSAFISC